VPDIFIKFLPNLNFFNTHLIKFLHINSHESTSSGSHLIDADEHTGMTNPTGAFATLQTRLKNRTHKM